MRNRLPPAVHWLSYLCSAAELEVVNEPSALEGAAAEQGEVEPLRPRGLAPKRLRDRTIEQDGRGRQQQRRKGGGNW